MEKTLMIFQTKIHEQIQCVKRSPHAALLGEEVYRKLENALLSVADTVTKSTVTRYIAREASAGNPFALSLPEMITASERQRAMETIEKSWRAGSFHFRSR